MIGKIAVAEEALRPGSAGQIGHLLAAEPAGMHHLRHQRRVGKARQADAAAIGFDDQFIYEELDQPMSERQLPMTQLLRDEALAGFRAWTELEGKTEY